MDLTITFDTEGREDDLVALFAETFSASEGPEEGHVIGALARDLLATTPAGDLLLTAADDRAGLAGAIIFTRMRYATDRLAVFVMGPVAVRTDRHGQGIGQYLIARGLDHLRGAGVDVALTYGDPGFYGRIGFTPVSEADVAAPFPLSQPEGWQGQSLTDQPIGTLAGPVQPVPAFAAPEFW